MFKNMPRIARLCVDLAGRRERGPIPVERNGVLRHFCAIFVNQQSRLAGDYVNQEVDPAFVYAGLGACVANTKVVFVSRQEAIDARLDDARHGSRQRSYGPRRVPYCTLKSPLDMLYVPSQDLLYIVEESCRSLAFDQLRDLIWRELVRAARTHLRTRAVSDVSEVIDAAPAPPPPVAAAPETTWQETLGDYQWDP